MTNFIVLKATPNTYMDPYRHSTEKLSEKSLFESVFHDGIWKVVDFFLDKFKAREKYHVDGARTCHGNPKSYQENKCQNKLLFGSEMLNLLTAIHPPIEKLNRW